MNFKERENAKVTVKAVEELAPFVGIRSEALAKMSLYVTECNDEIGWLGTAYKNEKENTIVIDDVFLFEQDVHATTTEITPEGLMTFGEELLSKENGMDTWNNLKVWGHSHVHMDVFPSGQDNHQMVTFKEGGHDWFIRIIANKKGEMKVDVYEYDKGISFIDVPWIEFLSQEEIQIKKQIRELEDKLSLISKGRVSLYSEDIKKEIKEKVRKIQFRSNLKHVDKKNKSTLPSTMKPSTYQHGIVSGGKKKESEERNEIASIWDEEDILFSEEDIYTYFTLKDLAGFDACQSLNQLRNEVETLGYIDFFTNNDLIYLYEFVREEFGGYLTY